MKIEHWYYHYSDDYQQEVFHQNYLQFVPNLDRGGAGNITFVFFDRALVALLSSKTAETKSILGKNDLLLVYKRSSAFSGFILFI